MHFVNILYPIKKRFSEPGTTEYILSIFFLKSHFIQFFLSHLSVLSLRFLLKHEGLGFAVDGKTS